MNSKQMIAIFGALFMVIAAGAVLIPSDSDAAPIDVAGSYETPDAQGPNGYFLITVPSSYISGFAQVTITADGAQIESQRQPIMSNSMILYTIQNELDPTNVLYTITVVIDNENEDTGSFTYGKQQGGENPLLTYENPANGTIAVTGADGTAYNSGDRVAAGTELTVTVTPTIENVDSVVINDVTVEAVEGVYSTTIIMPADGLTIVAVVTEAEPAPETYTVSYDQTVENGSVAVYNGETLVEPNGTIPATVTELTVVVTPAEGVDVASVTVNGTAAVLADGVYTSTVSVTGNVTVEAVIDLVEITYYNVAVAAGIENGAVAVSSSTVEAGQSVTVTVTPAKDYVLGTLAINDVEVDSTDITEADGVYTYTFVPIEDVEVSATFVQPADPDRTFTNQITLSDGAVIDAESYINASKTQEVVIAGDVTIVEGGYMIIDGKLTIAEGASLTIEDGGYVTVTGNGVVDVQGDLIVEGSETKTGFIYGGCAMIVAGTVTLEGANSFATADTAQGIEISGLFEVGDDAFAQLDGATVAEGGELLVYGIAVIYEDPIVNNGTVTVDSQGQSETVYTELYINNMAGATVDVVNVFGIILVTDEGMTFGSDDEPVKYVNGIMLVDVAGATVTGTMVVEENEDGVDEGINTLYLAGSVVAADNYNSTAVEGIIYFDGENIEVSETLALGEDVYAIVSGNLKVSGEVSALEPAVKENDVTTTQISLDDGEITVTGKITTDGGILGNGTVNAASYKTERTVSVPEYTVYTTLNTALTDGAVKITLSGDNELTADATIPVGTEVDFDGAVLTVLTVNEDVTLTVASDDRKSGKLNATVDDSVVVDGALVAQNYSKSGIREGAVESHTYKDVEDARTYTNIYSALADAADGETVKVSYGKLLTIEQDITIEAGITLLIPAGETVAVDHGITVTVAGTLVDLGTYTIAQKIDDEPDTTDVNEAKAAGATIVNGMMLYATNADAYETKIVGAYFTYTYEKSDINAIAPLASLPAIAGDIQSDIALYLDMDLGAIDFSAYDGEGKLKTIYVRNVLAVDTLTLGEVVLDVTDADASITGTVALANGTLVLANVNGIIASNETDNEDVVTSEIKGTVTAWNDPETENVTETGSMSVTGEIVAVQGFVINSAVVDEEPTMAMTVPAGATLIVEAGDFNAPVTVEGTVTIAGINVDFDMLEVTGTVAADGNYTANVQKLYVGVTADNLAMAGSGSVDALQLRTGDMAAVVYVSPNATVSEDMVEGLKSTEYYAEDALYLTAYALLGNVTPIDIPFSVDDAYFAGWKYTGDDGKAYDIIDAGEAGAQTIGAIAEVYADIEYEIYMVTITADAGIGTVAIDGNVLVNTSGNQFTLNTPIAAGQHTVSYTLKSGYQGTATLTVNGDGATISGMNFTLSGNEDNEPEIQVNLSLSGTEPGQTTVVVDSGDSGMGLTDYLLIILVVLIVVMAIIVALRMMRS